jgi:PAS domain S-box-containing protein
MLRAMADGVDRNLQFGPFELSSRERVLRREGVVLPLGSRALELLIYLAEHPGEVIAKQELIDHVWPDVTVEEGSLRVHVAAIRKAIGDGQFGNRYIANVKGRGYSFVGTVVPVARSTERRNAKFRYPGRLPMRPLMMIGRETVVGEVSDKLRNERFVTLLGPGGMGKTTIALAVGRAVAEEFDGNVHFADLENLPDSRHVTGGVSPAMEVTLSRKRVTDRTRGRKLHLTEAKARIGRARKTRADLEQELKACRREIARARERLAEAAMQQTATSEMLRLISNSPIQSVLDAVAEHAARLCDASNARIWRLENNLVRLVASYGESSATMDGREGLPADRDTVTGRAACDRRTIHVRDIAAEASEYPVGSRLVKDKGWRTTLATPLLREGTPIGTILVRRMEVRPFHEKQIALLETFADQAAIAIEKVSLFEAEKQRTLALARANRDLAEREAKIRRLVDSNIIGIFISGLKGRVLEANDAFLHLVGHDRDDLVSGRIRWTDLTPPEWRERDKRALAELSSNTIAQPYEKEFFRKDGSRVPVLVGGALFEGGSNEGVAFVVDLTERKRAELERRRLASLVEQAADLMAIADLSGERPIYLNKAGMKMVGFDSWEEARARRGIHYLFPEDRQFVNEVLWPTVLKKGSWSGEIRLRHFKTGDPIPVFYSGFRIDDPETGQPINVASVCRDITERKRAENLSQQIFERSTDRISIVGRDYRYQRVNPAFERRWGMPAETIVGMHVADLLGMESFEQLSKAYFDRCFAGEEVNYADWSTTPFGRRYLEATFSPLRPQSERVEASLVIIRDLTEHMLASEALRKAQMELAHANRVATMGQLTASITHEVNQPITAAVTYALAARRWLSAEPPNFREVDDALSLIVKEGNRAGEVVRRIRALIKKAPARKDAVAINDAILEVIALTRTEAANNSVAVRTQLAKGLPRVQGDRIQLQQVVLNLIINAIEAMCDVGKEERELLISSRNEADGVSVEVRDSGSGFTPAALERVFEAFYTTKPGGLGLGLSICRSIIEAHDGRLWASANLPRGASFRFIVPAHPAAAS